MRRLRLRTSGIVVALSLIIPATASAGMGEVVDIIIGLTGPQMFGLPIACEFNLKPNDVDPDAPKRACFIGPYRINGPAIPDYFWAGRNVWASVGGAAYFSTTKDSEMRPFDWFDAGMLAFEPTLNYRLFKTPSGPKLRPRFVIEAGAGGSLFYVFGDGFEPFVKGGIKLKPAAFTWHLRGNGYLGLAYNLRIFPNAFTSEDFGADTTTPSHNGRESAHGLTVFVGF